MAMDPELKQKWIDALKSGEYPKTTGQLYQAEPQGPFSAGYCCLGVLARVMNIPLNAQGTDFESGTAYSFFSRMFGRSCSSLWRINDSNPTFAEPIKWIEENL